MHVCEMADLPGHSVAITSTRRTKLERLTKLEHMVNSISKTNFQIWFRNFYKTKLFDNKIGASNFQRNYASQQSMMQLCKTLVHTWFAMMKSNLFVFITNYPQSFEGNGDGKVYKMCLACHGSWLCFCPYVGTKRMIQFEFVAENY